jgi:hypothetical protein
MNAMLIGLAWTYGTPFALYVFACLARHAFSFVTIPTGRKEHRPTGDQR